MATIRKLEHKDGTEFFEIKVSRGRKKAPLTMRWEPPQGWSRRAIERELNRVAADFERRVGNGEILSRAEQKELDRLAELERQKIYTVERFGREIFMPTKAPQMSINSINSFEGTLKTWVYPFIGNLPIDEVRPADIQSIFTAMTEKGRSHSSLQKVKVVIALLFKMAYLQDLIERDPMDKVLLPKMKQEEKMKHQEIQSYTKEEVQYILKCLENEPLKWQIFVKLAINTGARRGEIVALKWSDIDLETGTINISSSATYNPGVEQTIIGTTKNGKSRLAYIDGNLIQALKNYRFKQATESCISPYLFTKEGTAEPMHAQTPTWFFKRFGEKYGIPNFHPHILRHSFASLAITGGADIASVSELLGHSDKAVTLRMYSHADEESKQRAASLVRNLLAGNQ